MDYSEGNEARRGRRRFYRSREHRIFSGFLGGLGEYFDIDPIIIRLGFLAVFLFIPAGLGFVIFYIIGAIVTPLEPKETS